MKFTPEQILEMAREAGFYTGFTAMQTGDGLIPFALPIGARSCLAELERFAIIATQKAAQPEQEPLTDLQRAVIDAARAAMNDITETGDGEGGIKISFHLAVSLSLRLDEHDRAITAAHNTKEQS